jgi:two-component system sensor kinase FixL
MADRVITALSDFAKLPFPQVRPVRIDIIVAEALEISQLPASISLETALPADLPAISADADQLRIVLTNLIRNARDAMPEGGRLSATATEVTGFLELTLADTGQGVPPEVLARIMEPLFTTKARGLGLGLAISRAIVEKHGGQLLVSSRMGEGSTFTVRMPLARMKHQEQ